MLADALERERAIGEHDSGLGAVDVAGAGEQLLALWLKADAEPRVRKALAESLLDCTGVFDGEGLAAHLS